METTNLTPSEAATRSTERARAIIDQYARECGMANEDDDTVVTDIATDLMHLLGPELFALAADRATMHWEAEQ